MCKTHSPLLDPIMWWATIAAAAAALLCHPPTAHAQDDHHQNDDDGSLLRSNNGGHRDDVYSVLNKVDDVLEKELGILLDDGSGGARHRFVTGHTYMHCTMSVVEIAASGKLLGSSKEANAMGGMTRAETENAGLTPTTMFVRADTSGPDLKAALSRLRPSTESDVAGCFVFSDPNNLIEDRPGYPHVDGYEIPISKDGKPGSLKLDGLYFDSHLCGGRVMNAGCKALQAGLEKLPVGAGAGFTQDMDMDNSAKSKEFNANVYKFVAGLRGEEVSSSMF